jgi:hypothetical protein
MISHRLTEVSRWPLSTIGDLTLSLFNLLLQELLEDGDEIVVVRVADIQVNRKSDRMFIGGC